MKLAGQIDIQHRIQFLREDILDRRDRAGDSGVIDENVDAAERSQGIVHKSVNILDAAHVGDTARMIALGYGLCVDVAYIDTRAMRRERIRHRTTNPGPASGDDYTHASHINRKRS
jgi:hypothetical protein